MAMHLRKKLSFVSGRGRYEKCLIPGKVARSHACLYVPYGGKEISVRDYEILVSDDYRDLEWVSCTGGLVPNNAVKGGFDGDNTLYVARAKAPDGGLCIGKFHPEHGVCYFPWGGKEKHNHDCEVLTCKSIEPIPEPYVIVYE